MDRKHFLRLMALGGLLPIVVPGISGCKKYGPLDEFTGSVTIIGAGVAGLYAAWLLKQAGATVKILEATDRIGGRIKELVGFSDFAIELGAEEIHGHRSIWYDTVKDTNAVFIDAKAETDLIFIDNAIKELESLSNDADYEKLIELVDGIGKYNGADITFEEYMTQEGVAARMLPLANALFGNEYGTSNSHLGTKGVKDGENEWSAGDQNDRIKNRSFKSILDEKYADVLADVQLNTHVFRIDHSGDQVVCTDITGQEHISDKVIVTVSLGVLKSGIIDFVPDLSVSKADAIAKLGMGPGMKVILRFSSAFWPSGTGSIYGTGLVPEFWATAGGGRSANDNLLTAFVNGDNALTLSNLGSGLVPAVCAQLDQMFGGTVATDSLQDSHVEDWFANPYFQGTYSFPIVGSGNARSLLAAPVDGKLFFAGEATHTEGHFGTVHGAMETAYRAADEVVNS
jgi:monoamine oxidase